MKYHLLILALITSTALAETWTVDDDSKADFDNIQAAVDASSDGDEIIVMPGTYTGSGEYVISMNGKAVLLRSEEGSEFTIISGENQRTVLYCGDNETTSTIISGFTITQGNGFRGGILCSGSSPRIQNCAIIDNVGQFGGGMVCLGEGPDILEIDNCQFKNNYSSFYGGAIFAEMASFMMTNCIVRDNVGSYIGGIYVYCCGGYLQDTIVCSNANGQTYGTQEINCFISETCESCGDVNGDYIVNVADLLKVINSWDSYDIDADVTMDGTINVQDILLIVSSWGNDCSPPQLAACCFGDMKWGWCEFITEEECNSAGGFYMGDGTNCDSVSCY